MFHDIFGLNEIWKFIVASMMHCTVELMRIAQNKPRGCGCLGYSVAQERMPGTAARPRVRLPAQPRPGQHAQCRVERYAMCSQRPCGRSNVVAAVIADHRFDEDGAEPVEALMRVRAWRCRVRPPHRVCWSAGAAWRASLVSRMGRSLMI
jgi:hypothetical protein